MKEFLEKRPWLAIGVVAVLVIAVAFWGWRTFSGPPPVNPDKVVKEERQAIDEGAQRIMQDMMMRQQATQMQDQGGMTTRDK